jgi:DSF synthase
MDQLMSAAELPPGGSAMLAASDAPKDSEPASRLKGGRLPAERFDIASPTRHRATPRLPVTAVLDRARLGGPERTPIVAREAQAFDELEVQLDSRSKTYWCYMRPRERPSFTMGLLRDLASAQQSIRTLFDRQSDPDDPPLRYYVLASRLPGIFNLGGNLSLFADRIRRRDRPSLEAYARACIEVLYTNAVSFHRPVVTIALVQGDALGGGFEAALSCNVVIAERGAKFGLPEILFNLFPGMGAYSFLARRLGAVRAEEFILSGRTYCAEEMHALGLVHVLAEPGAGEDAARSYIAQNGRRHSAHCAVYQAARAVNPLGFDELMQIAELWVETTLKLSETDLRMMERLVARQDRRRAGPELLAAE